MAKETRGDPVPATEAEISNGPQVDVANVADQHVLAILPEGSVVPLNKISTFHYIGSYFIAGEEEDARTEQPVETTTRRKQSTFNGFFLFFFKNVHISTTIFCRSPVSLYKQQDRTNGKQRLT